MNPAAGEDLAALPPSSDALESQSTKSPGSYIPAQVLQDWRSI